MGGLISFSRNTLGLLAATFLPLRGDTEENAQSTSSAVDWRVLIDRLEDMETKARGSRPAGVDALALSAVRADISRVCAGEHCEKVDAEIRMVLYNAREDYSVLTGVFDELCRAYPVPCEDGI